MIFTDEILQDILEKSMGQEIPIENISIIIHAVSDTLEERGITLNGIST